MKKLSIHPPIYKKNPPDIKNISLPPRFAYRHALTHSLSPPPSKKKGIIYHIYRQVAVRSYSKTILIYPLVETCS